MSELVRDALDGLTPLRRERMPEWRDVLARAARERRTRGRRLAVAAAVAAALVAVASALAATGRGPFGELGSWLNGEPGAPASPSEQAGFSARNRASYAAFPPGTELRRVARVAEGGKRFTLLGFTSGHSLCLRLVRADLPAAHGSNECVSRADLDAAHAPAVVASSAYLALGARGVADGIYGFADDTVTAIEYRRGRGSWRSVPVANNVFLVLEAHAPPRVRTPPPAILQVRAVTSSGRRVTVPFASMLTTATGGIPAGPSYLSAGAQTHPGPQAVTAPFQGGTIGWLVRGEPRGSAWRPAPPPAGVGAHFGNVVFSRAIQPDPDDPLRVGLFLIRSGDGKLVVCIHKLEPLTNYVGWSCMPNRSGSTLFGRQPFSVVFAGSEQRQRLIGAAADEVASMRLFLTGGRVAPVALRDNAYSVAAPFTEFPATLAAYDAAGEIVGLAKLFGPMHATPCPPLDVWPAPQLPDTRPYQRLDVGALTLDGQPVFGRTPEQVEAALGTPDRKTTAALHNRSPEQRFFYGGTRPSGAELTVHFGSHGGQLLADRIELTGRGVVDPELGHVLNTPPQALERAIRAAYGTELRLELGYGTAGLGLPGCASELRTKDGAVRLMFGVTPRGARPYLSISRRQAR